MIRGGLVREAGGEFDGLFLQWQIGVGILPIIEQRGEGGGGFRFIAAREVGTGKGEAGVFAALLRLPTRERTPTGTEEALVGGNCCVNPGRFLMSAGEGFDGNVLNGTAVAWILQVEQLDGGRGVAFGQRDLALEEAEVARLFVAVGIGKRHNELLDFLRLATCPARAYSWPTSDSYSTLGPKFLKSERTASSSLICLLLFPSPSDTTDKRK